MYDNVEYASQRLEGTIVSFKGKPVRIDRCLLYKTRIFAEFRSLNNPEKYEKVPLEELDLTPIKLGFVNTKYGVCYLGRIPLRKDWKQGTRTQNMRIMWGGIDIRWVSDKDLYRTIVGKYPSFNTALEETVNTGLGIAFHKHFALMQEKDGVFLLYKFLGKVGDIVNNKPQLFDNYQFLNESLEQAMKGVLYA